MYCHDALDVSGPATGDPVPAFHRYTVPVRVSFLYPKSRIVGDGAGVAVGAGVGVVAGVIGASRATLT